MVACGDDEPAATTAAPTTTAGATTAAPTTTAGPATPMADTTSVTLGFNNPNRLIRSPIFVGIDQGLFAEVGIENVEINDADDPVPHLQR